MHFIFHADCLFLLLNVHEQDSFDGRDSEGGMSGRSSGMGYDSRMTGGEFLLLDVGWCICTESGLRCDLNLWLVARRAAYESCLHTNDTF